MRLRRLSLRGITRFADLAVDFAALPEGLIAIAGDNGSGKTTTLEAPFAALYGEFPTRPGGLYAVAHGRDARLELELENGSTYRALVAIDAERERTEAYLYDGAGAPLTSGKVREYAAEVERRFGSSRMMLSAALSCQTKRGAFLDLSKAERKDLLAEILDTAGLQALAEAARTRVKAGELQLERLRGQLAQAEAELTQLATAAASVRTLQADRDRTAATLAEWEAEVERLREQYAAVQASKAAAEATAAARQRIARDLADAEQRQAALARQRAGLAGERAALEARIGRARESAIAEADRGSEYRAAAERAVMLGDRLAELVGELGRDEDAVGEAQEAYGDRYKEALPLAKARAELAAAQRQAELLGLVPCTSAAPDLAGTCPLLANARTARDEVEGLEDQVATLEAVSAELPELLAAVKDAEASVKERRTAIAGVEAELKAAQATAARLPAAEAAESRILDLAAELAAGLAALEQRAADLAEEGERQAARRTSLAGELEDAPAVDLGQLDRELGELADSGRHARASVDQYRRLLRDADASVARAEEQARRRADLEQQAAQARTQADTLARDLAEWAVLERALGRDGIQALEIDAAGPELSALTNELLTECFGPRFEVAFVTQQLRADGKGQKEVFDVTITDHERGRRAGSVESLSGGEKTIVSEAISLALAVYVGRHSGRRYETLFRDETAGQLDPDNAQRYVAMLRRARLLAGAHQIVYIAQQPEVWQAADAVLYLRDGQLDVRTS